MTDTELEAKVAASAWEALAADSSDVATAVHLTREGRALELVADLIACPVIELDLGDIIELDSGVMTCEPIVHVRAIRVNTDVSWSMSEEVR